MVRSILTRTGMIMALGVMGTVKIASAQCAGPTTSDALDAASTYTKRQCLPPCLCVIAPQTGPLTGTLAVCFDHADATLSYYDVTADLTGAPTGLATVHLTGTGTFAVGQGTGATQQLTLDLSANGAAALHYDSGAVALGSLTPPSIAVTVQTPVQGCSQTILAIEATAACRADFNGVGGVTVQDIFDFLAAWFSGSPAADFNGVGGVTVQDIFDFLAAWFAGCP